MTIRRAAAARRWDGRVAVLYAVLGASVALPACRPAASPVPPADAGADPSARPHVPDAAESALLERIVRAETTLAYHGWRTVSQGPRGESRETRLRLGRAASGPVRIAWEGGEGPVRRWTVTHRFPWVERPQTLLRNYRIVRDPGPPEPVAWRPAERVRIEPRRPGRPSLEVLLDAETGLVLAECHRDPGGREWRSARFESIDYSDPGPAAGDAEPLEAPPGDAHAPEGIRPAVVASLPDGFERVRASTSPCGAWREDFTDGLAALSVLQAPATPGTPPAGEVRRRAWLGGATLSARVADLEVTVTGTVPADELLAVLRGLRPAVPPAR